MYLTKKEAFVKIIVLQKHKENLIGVKTQVAKLDAKRAEEIFYTTDPSEMLTAVRTNPDTFVVSGNVFDYGQFGPEVAARAKAISPAVRFFLYSVMPERCRYFDGIIPKENGTIVTGTHGLLAEILCAIDENTTPHGLKEKFPSITI